MLFTDGTYTAFVVPIGVGFNTSSVQWDWVGYFDFIAGEMLSASWTERQYVRVTVEACVTFTPHAWLSTLLLQSMTWALHPASFCIQSTLLVKTYLQ